MKSGAEQLMPTPRPPTSYIPTRMSKTVRNHENLSAVVIKSDEEFSLPAHIWILSHMTHILVDNFTQCKVNVLVRASAGFSGHD